ncbi:AraC family transcriptional regulator [Paenibacillus sp. J5C_2022]|uniref:AraC family transcriptional regulator n=1 Tax=Paenibacillus sp. J5C2022 TaxID=2977129 RepID=UPI0021CE4741|nr:AraC family transcriptional regulator [Paenibacillus sp. J5C2022]MCU6710734.1 AraC family transcriptional regulator [Paenibacillus sp. J5C2022]
MEKPHRQQIKPYTENLHYPFSVFESQFQRLRPHWHHHVELLYFLSGSGRVYLNGNEFMVQQGDLVLINSGNVHYFVSDEHVHTEHLCLQFDPEVLQVRNTIFEFKYILPLTTKSIECQQIFRNNELANTDIVIVLNDLLKEYTSKKYGFELAVNKYINHIILWILRYRRTNLATPGELPRENIPNFQYLLDYVEQNYWEDITVKQAAGICNLSYNYFSSQFNKIMRQSFNDYVNRIRIREAEKLMFTTDMNITEIAMMIGFTSSSYFIRQFKKYKTITPKQFIKKFTI